MIWITTLCLLFVIAWLLFNGLNERRWVKAHSHDETVASDEGLMYSLSAATRSGNPSSGSSGETQDNLFGKVLTKVKDGSSEYDRRLREKLQAGKAAMAAGDGSGEGFFERTTRKVASTSDNLSQKVAARAKNLSEGESVFGDMSGKLSGGMSRARSGLSKAAGEGEDLLTRVSNKVGSSISEIDNKIKARKNS